MRQAAEQQVAGQAGGGSREPTPQIENPSLLITQAARLILHPDRGLVSQELGLSGRISCGPALLPCLTPPLRRLPTPTPRTSPPSLLPRVSPPQRRRWISNLLLVLVGAVICALLFVMQEVVNRQLNSPSFSCGAFCLSCCDWLPTILDNGTVATIYQCYNATDDRPCSPYADCKVRCWRGGRKDTGSGPGVWGLPAQHDAQSDRRAGFRMQAEPAADEAGRWAVGCRLTSSFRPVGPQAGWPAPALLLLRASTDLALQAYNYSDRSVLYSTSDQVGYCPVDQPPLWPALVGVSAHGCTASREAVAQKHY